ncbi:unnamed protein product [Sympodiomycopsis kandeliae]
MTTPSGTPTSAAKATTNDVIPNHNSDTQTIFSPILIPSILPRIESIVSILTQVSRHTSPTSTHSISKPTTQDPDPNIGSHTDSLGPSIALGAISDESSSIFDFLSQATSTDHNFSSSNLPRDVIVELIKQSKELQDVYRRALESVDSKQGGKEWGADWCLEDGEGEVMGVIKELERRKEEMRQSHSDFVDSWREMSLASRHTSRQAS